MFRIIYCFLLFILLTACAAPNTVRVSYDNAELDAEAALQRVMALKKYFSYKQRLQNVSYPILKAANTFCSSKGVNSMGAQGSASADFQDIWRTAANKILGGDEFIITWIAEKGPAENAGLALNDKVIAVNNVQYGIIVSNIKSFTPKSIVFEALRLWQLIFPSSVITKYLI